MPRPVPIDEGVALSRHTTIGTGGPARFFARPGTLAELQELLAWAHGEGHAVETIGLGSNLLVHDDGVDALVLKLAGELATAHVEGDVLAAVARAVVPLLPLRSPIRRADLIAFDEATDRWTTRERFPFGG